MKALYFEEHGGTDKLIYGERPEARAGNGRGQGAAEDSRSQPSRSFRPAGDTRYSDRIAPHRRGGRGWGRGCDRRRGRQRRGWREVVFDPGLSCGQCEYCRAGEHSLCVRFGVLGEHSDGTFAEAVVVSAQSLAPRPTHLSWEESAAFGLAHLTAWRMLINRGGLRPGETVLIHGIGGGVSMACLQLAKLVGARVIVTSRSRGQAPPSGRVGC